MLQEQLTFDAAFQMPSLTIMTRQRLVIQTIIGFPTLLYFPASNQTEDHPEILAEAFDRPC